MHEDGQLSALDIDLQEVYIVDLDKTVQALRLNPRLSHYPGIVLEEAEDLEGGRAGNKYARPTGIGTEVEDVLFAVAYRIGKVGLIGPLLEVQFGESRGLRLKAGDATELSVQKRPVRRRAVDRIGADVDDMSQTAHAQEARQIGRS